MARRWPGGSPGHYVRFHRSIKSGTLGLTETPKNQDTAQSFQRILQVGHYLIASGPAALSVGFCTVAIVTPTHALLDLTPMNEERCECGHRFGSPRGQVPLMDRMAHYDVCPLTLADKRAASSPAKPVRRSEPKTGPAVSDDRS